MINDIEEPKEKGFWNQKRPIIEVLVVLAFGYVAGGLGILLQLYSWGYFR